MADNNDARVYTSGLAKDLDELTESMDGMMYKFGQWGRSNNKIWTIFARFTSGTVLWRAQARIRALSNVFEILTDAQGDAMKANLKSLDSYMRLSAGMKKAQTQTRQLQEIYGDLYNATDEVARISILEGAIDEFPELMAFVEQGKDAMESFTEVMEIVEHKQDQFDKKIQINQKGLLGYYKDIGKQGLESMKKKMEGLQENVRILGDFNLPFGIGEQKADRKGLGKGGDDEDSLAKGAGKLAWEGLKEIGKTAEDLAMPLKVATGQMAGLVTGTMSKIGEKTAGGNAKGKMNVDNPLDKWAKAYKDPMKSRLGKLQAKLIKGVSGILGTAKKFFGLAVKGLIGFAMYGTIILIGLLIVIKFFKKVGPKIWDAMKTFKPFLELMWDGLKDIFTGIWEILQGLWEGDLIKVLSAFWFKVVPGLAKLVIGLVGALVGLLLSVLWSIYGAIYDGIIYVGKKIGKIWPFADGGVTKGGMSLVGEKGPELVSLPTGSRVHSNADSKKMVGGNTIHIHINGRVGASDAEIRDIANKVAREINLRMNRTGTNIIGA